MLLLLRNVRKDCSRKCVMNVRGAAPQQLQLVLFQKTRFLTVRRDKYVQSTNIRRVQQAAFYHRMRRQYLQFLNRLFNRMVSFSKKYGRINTVTTYHTIRNWLRRSLAIKERHIPHLWRSSGDRHNQITVNRYLNVTLIIVERLLSLGF